MIKALAIVVIILVALFVIVGVNTPDGYEEWDNNKQK